VTAKRKELSAKKLMSAAIPLVSAAVPLVSGEIPLVSGYIPLVSARPPITIPRYWGLIPLRQWGKTKIPVRRKGELRPTDIGLFKFLAMVAATPWQPRSYWLRVWTNRLGRKWAANDYLINQ